MPISRLMTRLALRSSHHRKYSTGIHLNMGIVLPIMSLKRSRSGFASVQP